MNVKHLTHIDHDFNWTSQTEEDVEKQVKKKINQFNYLRCFHILFIYLFLPYETKK